MYKRFKTRDGSKEYILEEDLAHVGWYLYVFENGLCIRDHYKDTFDSIKKLARVEYLILETAWKPF